MGASNTTPNLGLSQFEDSDKPTWLGDYTGDMAKIDSYVTTVDGQIVSISANVLTAVRAADSATAAVAEAERDLSASVQALASSTSAALENQKAEIEGSISTLSAQSATIEDLFMSVTIAPRDYAVNSSQSLPVFTAPFPLDVTSIRLVQWPGGAGGVTQSDSNFWTVTAQKINVGGTAQIAIAAKTTKVTGGSAISSRMPWTFDTSILANPQMVAGETFNMSFTPTGTPPQIDGPIIISVGYRPR